MSVPEAALSRTGHSVVAVCLGIIFVLGFVNNFLVLMLFTRFHFLRTPINLLLLNISVSDMLVCLFGTPFSFAASICGRWLTGAHGCRWYGFANTLFGVVSLVSLALLSYERCCSVLCGSKMDVLDHRKVRLSIAGCWVYSLIWTVPPLFGWSGYGPEGPGTTCSVRWALRTPGSRAYIICLFIFCLVLPLLTIIFCYGRILITVHGVRGPMEGWVLLMVLIMVSCYLFCWLPYGVVALLGTFGPSGSVSPTASIVPSVLAKSSTVLNPIIYAFFNKQVQSAELQLRTITACIRTASLKLWPLAAIASAGSRRCRLDTLLPSPSAGSRRCRLDTLLPSPSAGSRRCRLHTLLPSPSAGSRQCRLDTLLPSPSAGSRRCRLDTLLPSPSAGSRRI
uniref:G-protein coupled receptors family 1 profile domain-containing protein n=1 Tax=Pygocentrus nattereri TaxID=42514 RepID=A0AAR2J166_PYGNA